MEEKSKSCHFGITDLFESKYRGGWIGRRIYTGKEIPCKVEIVVKAASKDPTEQETDFERTPFPYELFSQAFNAGFLEYMGKSYDKNDGCTIEYWRVR